MKENQPIVFAYWVNNEFKGFRADTFGTISQKHPKIYIYSEEQVKIVVNGTQSSCNKKGTSLIKQLSGMNNVFVNTEGQTLKKDSITDHISNTEDIIRNWEEFELRIHPFIDREIFYSLGEGDEWKIDKLLSELEPEIEIYKFKILANEN